MSLRDLKNEKEQAVETALLANYEKYYRLAYSYLHSAEDAMDVVQEGAYKAILKSETLREPGFAGTWVYRIMLNEIFGFCRENSRRIQNLGSEMPETVPGAQNEPRCEDAMDLRSALQKLGTDEQRILELRYFEGMRIADVAEKMNMNLSTVKSKLYRSIEKLRIEMSV